MEVAVTEGGTDVLETDVERTDIFESGVLEARAGGGDSDGGGDDCIGSDSPDVPDVCEGNAPHPAHPAHPEPETAGPAPDERRKPRDTQALTSRLTMLFVALAALAGLVVLAVAIGRELAAADGSDDAGDLAYSYTCDKVSGSDPGVFGTGNCRPYGGVQASGVIPAGQAYVLIPRKANALGYTQTFSCSGGRAESPSMVVPRRCAAIGRPVLASR